LEAYIKKARAKGNPETSEIIDHLTWRHIQISKFIFRLNSFITLKGKIWPRHEALQKEHRYRSQYSYSLHKVELSDPIQALAALPLGIGSQISVE
jgi:hypothetical protein